MERAYGYEANPFLSAFSGDNLILIKVAGVVVIALLLLDIHRRRPAPAISATLVSIMVYSVIVFWNVGVFVAESGVG